MRCFVAVLDSYLSTCLRPCQQNVTVRFHKLPQSIFNNGYVFGGSFLMFYGD